MRNRLDPRFPRLGIQIPDLLFELVTIDKLACFSLGSEDAMLDSLGDEGASVRWRRAIYVVGQEEVEGERPLGFGFVLEGVLEEAVRGDGGGGEGFGAWCQSSPERAVGSRSSLCRLSLSCPSLYYVCPPSSSLLLRPTT